MEGKIIKYFSDRGFGFIQYEEPNNYHKKRTVFFHLFDYQDRVQSNPVIGDTVTFELTEGRDLKSKAINVTVVEDEYER